MPTVKELAAEVAELKTKLAELDTRQEQYHSILKGALKSMESITTIMKEIRPDIEPAVFDIRHYQ